jgi:hypothetical protein
MTAQDDPTPFDPGSIRSMTMSWRLREPWNCGPLSIPAGTVLTAEAHCVTGAVNGPVLWQNVMSVTLPLPTTAEALDSDAANALRDWYPRHQWYLLWGAAADYEAFQERKANWRATCERLRVQAMHEELERKLTTIEEEETSQKLQ